MTKAKVLEWLILFGKDYVSWYDDRLNDIDPKWFNTQRNRGFLAQRMGEEGSEFKLTDKALYKINKVHGVPQC